MSSKTLEQLAESLKIEVQRLIEIFAEVGFEFTADSVVSDEAEQAFLNKEKGKKITLGPKKITLKRQSKTEIKVQRSSGQKGTVSVVRKKRHVYVKRDAQSPGVEEDQAQNEAGGSVADERSNQYVETASSETLATDSQLNAHAAVVTSPVTEEYQIEKPSEAVSSSAALESTNASRAVKKEDWSHPTKKGSRSSRDLFEEGEKKRGKSKLKSRDDEEQWHKGNIIKVIGTLSEETEENEEIETEVESAQTPPRSSWKAGRVKSKSAKDAATAKAYKKEIKGFVEEIQKKHLFEKPAGPLVRDVLIGEVTTAADLANKMSIKAAEVIKTLMKLGIIVTINQPIDKDTAVILVEELGHIPKIVKETTPEDSTQFDDSAQEQSTRAPIVTVMGHVDHGKTSLLDYIRKTKVTAKEAGGITQHIGAYHVKTDRGEITFLDTPGHAAFTAMRARGVKCTDIVVLVVAADDGVMPQTVEAIQHAKAAQVPIIVAINKMDKKGADIERIQTELSNQNLVPEAWGGDVIFVPVSAKEGTGIDALLEAICLQAEMLELKAPHKGRARGIVLEARLDKTRGAVASVLVQAGTLHRGDILLTGQEFGRIRAMINELGNQVEAVGPSMPVEVLGLSNTPQAGDVFIVMEDERKAREVAVLRESKSRDVRMLKQGAAKLEGFFDKMQQGGVKTLNLIIKTDVQGSAEALTEALGNLSTDEVKVKIIAVSVGGINESDITLTLASGAVLIGFNVRADLAARRLAEREGVDIYYSSIIYEVVDNVKRAVNGLLDPQYKEQIIGLAEVRDVFRSAKFGAVAGCMVQEGLVKRGYPIRVLRNNVVIYQGELESLRRFKEDISEVRNGMECGIGVKNYNDVKVGDQIEIYETIEVLRK